MKGIENQMDELSDLIYSNEAAINRIEFYQGYNDVNFFVEDKEKEYEYETILNRLLEGKFRISSVFALGGKKDVIKRFYECGEISNGIKNIYIVDGDFDRYTYPDEMINTSCFIYLKAYNIESYFIDENACYQFAKGKMRCVDKVVKEKINFKHWKTKIVHQAKKLFLCYCFLKKYHPSEESVGRNHYLFIEQISGFEREDGAYDDYWKSILMLDQDAPRKIKEIAQIYEYINGNDYYNLICGKFLFTSLYCHLRNIIGKSFPQYDLRWHLINNFKITSLDYVKEAILAHIDS